MSVPFSKNYPDNIRSRRIGLYLLLSFLLHLLLFIIYGLGTHYHLLALREKIPPQAEKRIVFEIVETPKQSNTSTKPKQSDYLSDKDMKAQNPIQTKHRGNTPFASGEFEQATQLLPKGTTKATETTPVTTEATQAGQKSSLEQSETEFAFLSPDKQKFSRDLLTGKSSRSGYSTDITHRSEKFSVDDLGGFAFNTYNWDFAPYLLQLKKTIQRHIFPPPAFTQMGIINGKNIVRFKILPNGQMRDLVVISYQGHKSLVETSINAIANSAPFRPLPANFPEPFLEVTASFWYITHGVPNRNNQRN